MKLPARPRVPAPRSTDRRGRAARALVVVLLLPAGFAGCGGSAARKTAKSAHAEACAIDQTREYYCEDLLPLATSMPAPSPYEACPAMLDDPASEYDPAPPFGLFDTSYTEYTRKRAPPGHSCCYSWCDKVKLADASAPSIQTACRTATAFREEFCMAEPEGGASDGANAPYDRCPAAIVPPARAVFSSPDSAAFDAQQTAAHRAKGGSDCCYAWCSQAPPGSGLLKKR
ncbi:MAG TPA: hypothetical protein VH062_17390 [Polyangiaceae bacterium]|jgi:hypothetical protein|nr:hypothetical protein [Polyangiaceae bacterium]